MKMGFGDWLRSQIKLEGYTQAEFAELVGIKQPQLSRIISGERGASTDVLERVANLLSLPADEVFRKAGLLPELTEKRKNTEKIVAHRLADLSDRQVEEVLFYIDMIIRRDEELPPQEPERETREKKETKTREGETPPEVLNIRK